MVCCECGAYQKKLRVRTPTSPPALSSKGDVISKVLKSSRQTGQTFLHESYNNDLQFPFCFSCPFLALPTVFLFKTARSPKPPPPSPSPAPHTHFSRVDGAAGYSACETKFDFTTYFTVTQAWNKKPLLIKRVNIGYSSPSSSFSFPT